jgi:hypothetical protein
MKHRIKEIVLEEDRPFSFPDFRHFEVHDEEYEMSHGTFRNYLSILKKQREIELAYRDGIGFYTIPGRGFAKLMTSDHMGGNSSSSSSLEAGRKTPIYKWIKNLPVEKQSVHNLRLIFSTIGIWKVFSTIYHTQANDSHNKDIKLSTWTFLDDIDVIITIHHTDTVSIAIACSYRPIAICVDDIPKLFEVLIRTEVQLSRLIEDYCKSSKLAATVIVPRYSTWIVKMWHFGVDGIDEYSGKEFEVTIEEGLGDLFRIYTKRLRHSKKLKLRAEHQEYPNSPIVEAILDKLYPNGYLMKVSET